MKYLSKSAWVSSQKLSDRGMFRHGRAWLHSQRGSVRFEWHHGKGDGLALILRLAGGDSGNELTLHIAIPLLFSYFLTLDFPFFERWMPHEMYWSGVHERLFRFPVQRQIGIRFFDWTLWVSLWEKTMEWSRKDPKWWSFNINFPDLILGGEKRTSHEVLRSGSDTVKMPERDYPAHYEITRTTYKRPRWFRRSVTRIDIEMDTPIPVPGKGENSWDMEDDAIFSMSVACEGACSVPDAIARLHDGAMRDRERYGGKGWLPEGFLTAVPVPECGVP